MDAVGAMDAVGSVERWWPWFTAIVIGAAGWLWWSRSRTSRRPVELQLHNATPWTLRLSSSSSEGGTWLAPPPPSLAPNSNSFIRASSSASVEYKAQVEENGKSARALWVLHGSSLHTEATPPFTWRQKGKRAPKIISPGMVAKCVISVRSEAAPREVEDDIAASSFCVHVVRGTNLPKCGAEVSNGDFYVILALRAASGEQRASARTRVMWNSGSTANFNQVLVLEVDGSELQVKPGDTLVADIWERDYLDPDDYVGRATFSVGQLQENQTCERPVDRDSYKWPLRDDGALPTLQLTRLPSARASVLSRLLALGGKSVAVCGSLRAVATYAQFFEHAMAKVFPESEAKRARLLAVAVARLSDAQAEDESKKGATPLRLQSLLTLPARYGGLLTEGATVSLSAEQAWRDMVSFLGDTEVCPAMEWEPACSAADWPMEGPVEGVKIGVVGGMGPEAGADFLDVLYHELEKLLPPSPGSKSPIEIFFHSNPSVEGVKDNILEAYASSQGIIEILNVLHSGTAGWLSLMQSAASLDFLSGRADTARLDVTCCASNTFHLIFGKVPRLQPEKLVSILDATAGYIKERFPAAKVAVLGTAKSVDNLDLGYGRALREQGVEFARPQPDLRDKTQQAIECVKKPGADAQARAKRLLLEVVVGYAELGCTVVLMGCTEIPLALRQDDADADARLQGRRVHLVSSTAALAHVVARQVQELLSLTVAPHG